jgi:ketosteroid isomerase-like protein
VFVIPGGGDLALVIFPWTSTAVLANGETKKWQGTATDVVRRQADGRWLLVLDNATGVEEGRI